MKYKVNWHSVFLFDKCGNFIISSMPYWSYFWNRLMYTESAVLICECAWGKFGGHRRIPSLPKQDTCAGETSVLFSWQHSQGKADWKCLYVFYWTVFSVLASVGLSCSLKSLSVHLSIQWEGSLILKVLLYSRYFLLNFNFLNEKWGDTNSRAFMQMLTLVGLCTL